MAFDYGLSDDAVYILGAVDEKEGILYIYDECRTNDNNIEVLANMFFEFTKHIPVGGWITAPIIDPKSGPKRDYDKKSLSDHFLDYGIGFKPGFVNVDARIFRLNTYFETGRIKIMRKCKGLIWELDNYKFKADESLSTGFTGKPVDKDNHGINALEWITMELPADPKNLLNMVYGRDGNILSDDEAEKQKQRDYWALADPEEDKYKFMEETPYDVDYSMIW